MNSLSNAHNPLLVNAALQAQHAPLWHLPWATSYMTDFFPLSRSTS